MRCLWRNEKKKIKEWLERWNQNTKKKKKALYISLFLQYFQGNGPKHQMLIKSSLICVCVCVYIYKTTVFLLKVASSLSSQLVSLFSGKTVINNGK